jgi:hypothetical protein
MTEKTRRKGKAILSRAKSRQNHRRLERRRRNLDAGIVDRVAAPA